MDEMKARAKDVSSLLKVLANENRLLILCELANGPLSVSALLEKLQITQSGISQHLALLKANGILDCDKKAQTVVYHIKDERIYGLMGSLKALYCDVDMEVHDEHE